MIPYFRDPAGLGALSQAQVAHVKKPMCCALTTAQLESNGDVTVCSRRGPIGNVKHTPFRQIWENRPRHWEMGCCLWETPGNVQAEAPGSGLLTLQEVPAQSAVSRLET
jgi:hypothetical protein